jgi:hypothetical protein
MGKHHTARLLLTAGAGLLTACTPHAWPLIVGSILLTALMLILSLLISRDRRTPFERIVVLLCILRRIDPHPYLWPPEISNAERHRPMLRDSRDTSTGPGERDRPKTPG